MLPERLAAVVAFLIVVFCCQSTVLGQPSTPRIGFVENSAERTIAPVAIYVSISEKKARQVLEAEGYSEVRIAKQIFGTAIIEACKDGVKYQLKVDPDIKVWSRESIGQCDSIVASEKPRSKARSSSDADSESPNTQTASPPDSRSAKSDRQVSLGRRVALLIGNQDYRPGVGKLVNPFNDIKLVGKALHNIGFELLPPVKNGTRFDILDALDKYTLELKNAGRDAIGFVYYSGHGIASRGVNYIVPVDLEAPSTGMLRAKGVRQSELLAILQKEAPSAAHYLVFDACRNELRGARGSKGFVPVNQQAGVLIAFATAPGQTASDLGSGSGPYARALAAELVKPDLPDLLMFHNVRVAVSRATGGDQVPWTLDGIQRAKRHEFASGLKR